MARLKELMAPPSSGIEELLAPLRAPALLAGISDRVLQYEQNCGNNKEDGNGQLCEHTRGYIKEYDHGTI